MFAQTISVSMKCPTHPAFTPELEEPLKNRNANRYPRSTCATAIREGLEITPPALCEAASGFQRPRSPSHGRPSPLPYTPAQGSPFGDRHAATSPIQRF